MRALIVAAAVTAVGFALPAAAQNNGSWNSNRFDQQQGYNQGGQNLQQKIRQDLGQAGFTDIHIIPRSFVVSARDRDGNPVEMMITPNSITAMTSGLQNQNGANEGGQNYSQNNQNGWNGGNGYGRNSGNNGNGYSQNGPMGDNGMGNSADSGNMINSPNGNGSYSR